MRVIIAFVLLGVLAIIVAGELQERSAARMSGPSPEPAGPAARGSSQAGSPSGAGALPSAGVASAVPSGEEAAVAETFNSFKSSLLGRSGQLAADVVSEGTLHYYDQIASMAVSAERPIIASQPFLTQLMVYRVRQLTPGDQLRQLTGRSLLSYAVEQGWTGTSVGRMRIGQVKVLTLSASATTVMDDERAGPTLQFRREGDRWKLDFVPMLEYANRALEEEIIRSGKDPQEVVAALARETR